MNIELSVGSATVKHWDEVVYSGPVVEWNPQKIRFSGSLSSNYLVRQIAEAIFLSAEEIGAIKVKREGRNFTESKIVARLGIHCTEFFAERDRVEWRVREEILRLYRPDTHLILGVGHPKKVHAIFYGSLVEINKTVIVIQADRILHVRSNQIVVYSKPSIVEVKKKKDTVYCFISIFKPPKEKLSVGGFSFSLKSLFWLVHVRRCQKEVAFVRFVCIVLLVWCVFRKGLKSIA